MTPLFVILLSVLCLSFANASLPINGSSDEVIAYIDKIPTQKNTDPTLVPALVQLLKDPNSEIKVRERAAWALGELEAKSAAPALIEAAKDKGLLVRSAAMDALVRLRARSALPTFSEIAKHDPVLSMRQRATIALGLLQWEKTIPVLVELAGDTREEIRGAAALSMALTHSKKNDFSEALKQMASDPNAYVRERVEKGLQFIYKKHQALREDLTSADADFRLLAAVYFHRHGGKNDLKPVEDAYNGESSDEIRFELQRALSAIKKRSTSKTAAPTAHKKKHHRAKPASAAPAN